MCVHVRGVRRPRDGLRDRELGRNWKKLEENKQQRAEHSFLLQSYPDYLPAKYPTRPIQPLSPLQFLAEGHCGFLWHYSWFFYPLSAHIITLFKNQRLWDVWHRDISHSRPTFLCLSLKHHILDLVAQEETHSLCFHTKLSVTLHHVKASAFVQRRRAALSHIKILQKNVHFRLQFSTWFWIGMAHLFLDLTN